MDVLVVEDEQHHQEVIVRYLNIYVPEVQTIRLVSSIAEAASALREQLPTLLLLDIHLPDGTSFDLLQQFPTELAKLNIIFISADDDYAIKAFRFSAIDYILKPVNALEFQEAIGKAVKKTSHEKSLSFGNLQSQLQDPAKPFKTILLKDANAVYVVEIDQIIRCESSNNYTIFFLADDRKITVSTTLKEYDRLLKPHAFFRSHQSHLINIHYFDHYDKRDGGYLVMKDQSIVPISRRKKDQLMELLERGR